MKIFKNKKILSVFNDAGAANIGLSYLKHNRIKSQFYCIGPSLKILRNIFPKAKNSKNLINEIKKSDVVITGSSSKNNIEFITRSYCKKKKIFSLTFLDHWVNYKNRFKKNNYEVLPDLLITSDVFSYLKAREVFKKILVKKYPNYYLNDLIKKIKGMKQGQKLLYSLEPFDNKIEFTALNNFFGILRKHKVFNKEIILRLHPSEKKNKYNIFIKRLKDFKVKIDEKSSMQKLIASAKYVFGLESNALVISLRAKKKVFTLLPLYNRKFRLPFKKIKNINKLKNF